MRICVVDFETTGEAPPEHAPCEIGTVDLISTTTNLTGDPWGWEPCTVLASFCNPGVPMPAETAAIHHILDEDLVGAVGAAEAVRLLGARSDVDCFAAHGMQAERQWLTDELTGGKPWIDTYRSALRLWPDAPGHGLQVLRYWRMPTGLVRQRGLPAHRAGPDAYVTAFLLRDMLELATPAQLIEWSSKPALLRRVPFGQHRGRLWTEVDYGLLEWTLRKDFGEDILYTAQHEMDRRDAESRERQQAYSEEHEHDG